MKLSDKEFKRMKELQKLDKEKKLTDEQKAEYAELYKKWKNKDEGRKNFKPGNAFEWWNKIPELTKDCANFKSNFVAGMEISNNVPFIVPGVLTVGLDTCYSCCVSPTDPVNVWARDLYLRMFQKYRPASGYSASDLAISIFAALEAVKVIASYERIYGIINRYSIRNVNMPLVEAKALGLTTAQVTYLQGHLSDFRYDLNYLLRKAQRLCIPKDIAIIEQAISLFGYEFLDHENPRAQIIMFKLKNYGVYSDTVVSTGGEICFYPNFTADLFDFTAENMCKALSTVLDALLGSDSIQRIFADLVVWFGAEAMLQFMPIPEDYIVTPVYAEEILHELHNLETVAQDVTDVLSSFIDADLPSADQSYIGNGYYHVYQVDDRIVTAATYHTNLAATPVSTSIHGYAGDVLTTTSGAITCNEAHLINGPQVDPDEQFIIEGSMFKACTKAFIDNGSACGIIESNTFYIVRDVALYDNVPNSTPVMFQSYSVSAAAAQSNYGAIALVDWAPLAYYWNGENTILGVFGDIDVPVPVNATELKRIHRTTFLSGIHTDMSVVNK